MLFLGQLVDRSKCSFKVRPYDPFQKQILVQSIYPSLNYGERQLNTRCNIEYVHGIAVAANKVNVDLCQGQASRAYIQRRKHVGAQCRGGYARRASRMLGEQCTRYTRICSHLPAHSMLIMCTHS